LAAKNLGSAAGTGRRDPPSGDAMPTPDAGDVPAGSDEARVQSLLGVLHLIGRHTRLDEFLPDLAGCLRTVADFDLLGIVLPVDEWKTARLYAVRLGSPEAAPATEVQSVTVPPLDKERLSAAAADQAEAIVLDRLDAGDEHPGVVAALRGLGERSACLLPLGTALGPVGFIAFASSREGTYSRCDIGFLRHVGRQVAVAIDNVRHQEEALARERQLQAEREHLSTLLELTNEIVTARDLPAVLAAIAPHLQRVVSHDAASLYLMQPGSRQLGVYAISPRVVGWTDELTSQIRPEAEPVSTWLGGRQAVDLDVERFDWSGREAIRRNLDANGVKRVCILPLATARGRLGLLVLDRRSPRPFSREELEGTSRAATQIAIALENALAFDEIATLKDRLSRENVYLEQEVRSAQHFGEIVAESAALKRILGQVATVGPTDSTVLVLGETGTGKELIARAIHAASERRGRPLVTVNCATSPAGLLESEWFGHEKGAFTGALSQKVGRFELAHQGTLFLDEIGDVPLDLQSKLLRALQEREIERLGSTRTTRVDFRLVAATNRNIEDMAAKREFRSDLYYRLNVFPIRIPPLRERREDIPPLVLYFVQRFAKRLRRPIESVARESMEMLCRWPWPGNVRELQNVIERAVILSQGPTLTVPRAEFEGAPTTTSTPVTLEDVEREHILRTLDQTGWVIGGPHGAADRLGLKRTSLVSTMRRLGIVRPKPHDGRSGDARAR
jgi:formate hydrogenlyase transcriptional activator